MIRHCLSSPATSKAGRYLPVFIEFSSGFLTFVQRICPSEKCVFLGVGSGCGARVMRSEFLGRSVRGRVHSTTFQFPNASRSAVMRTSLPSSTPSGTNSSGKAPRGCLASAACHARLPSGRVPVMRHGRLRMRCCLSHARSVMECDRHRPTRRHSRSQVVSVAGEMFQQCHGSRESHSIANSIDDLMGQHISV